MEERIMETVYGCGHNGFRQLDDFHQMNEVSEGCQQTEKAAKQDWQVKHSNPKLLCQLKKVTIEDVKITWSRMAVCFKRGTGSFMTVISGHVWTDDKPETDKKNKFISLDDIICQAATHTDIIFKDTAKKKDLLVLQDGKNACKILKLHSGQTPEVDLNCVSGGHDKFHCIHNERIFGQFSCSNVKEESPDVSDSLKGINERDKMLVNIHHFEFIMPIKQVSCGKEHVLLLREGGDVLSFGLSSRGQLGHGDVESEGACRIVESLEGLPIKAVAAGGWHSVALSEIGDVYVWGWNESGQLGLSSRGKDKSQSMDETTRVGIQAVPKCLDVPAEANVKAVACGTRHTVILSEEGRVFTCGWNKYGQLGLGHFDSVDSLMEVKGLPGPCSKVFAGQWNSVFVCKD